MSDAGLIALAQEQITDPTEHVLAAGRFQPHGTLGLGLLVPSVVGRAAAAANSDEPPLTLIAVTSDRVYAFAVDPMSEPRRVTGQYAAWPRDQVRITTRDGLATRVLDVQDTQTGQTYAFESPRLWPWHGAEVAQALAAGT